MDLQIEKSEAWVAFVDMRKAKGKRAPFTDFAKTRILFELRRLAADGHDIEEVLWNSVTNGWSGVFPVRKVGWQAPTLSQTVPSIAVEKTQQWIRSHAEPVSNDREAVSARLAQAKQKLRGAA